MGGHHSPYSINTFPKISDPTTHQRLLANLRQTRLEMEELNLELAQINLLLSEQLRKQRKDKSTVIA